MADKWTKEQYQAISARDTSLIVSAAAGSGKTSVLVERLIRQLSSSENKIPADRIIVVTFTNDAASEMKLRLNAALSKLLEQEPENEWLYEQQSLIQSANISTIHSFCFNLIRENIQSLDISSGFRIIDESEDKIILKKALDMVIEQYCSDNSEMMKRLTDFFCTKGTFQLENTILKIYNFVITIPFYQEWLEKQLDLYSENSDISQWKNIYMEFLKNNLENFIQEAEEAKALCMEIEADAAYELINLEAMAFDRINKIITDENIEWDKKMSEFPSVLFDRIKFPKLEKDSFEAEIAESVKKIRNTYKSKFNKLVTEALFSEQEIKDDKEFVRIIFSDIIEVINRLDETVSLMKNEINGISFSDAERLTIGLLAEKNESGSVVKTELAQKLSEYYRIIMIDEFQDANNSQDLIFKMLSNNGTAEKYGDNAFLVGDIKQSIYRFRLANPMIFLNTLLSSNEYTEDFQGENAYVKLNKNFRSSSDVVNFVNFIFGRIMSVKTGEIDYTDDEKLIQGAIFPEKDRTTEILLVNTTESNADEETESDDETEENEKEIINKEAFAVASKIKSMLNDKINVSHKGIERPCVPADFCILLRNRASGTLFSEALKSFGILAHTDEVEGYLKSREITVLLNFLKVIDNPLLDIPLTSVLMSPIFMLSAEEMAEIRLFSKGESVYKALCISIGEIEDSDLEGAVDTESSYYRKALYFYDTLKRLRYLASGYGLEKLIRTIYDSTDFLSVVQIYRDGEQKRANLQLLLEYAKNYEETQNGGLSGFLRYIASVSANGGDLKRAGTVSLNDDVVTVKTIHKSKGLEFPFVFLCRTSSSFNSIDQRNQVQMSFSDVIGFKIQDKKQLKSYMTLPFIAVREQNRMNSMSEEMRLLYVALTRAKEKLFITLDINEKSIKKMKSFARDIEINKGITPRLVSKAGCMQDWLITALLTHKDADALRNLSEAGIFLDTDSFPIKFIETEELISSGLLKENMKTEAIQPDKTLENEVIKNIAFDYDMKNANILSKLTVSEISKKGNDILLKRPEFITENNSLSGAEKGTALHTFMQFSDYAKAEADILVEINRLVSIGALTKKQGDSVSVDKLKAFFGSKLYQRIKKSENVMRERKLLMRISDLDCDDEFLEAYKNTDGMLQGIADCIFEEDDGYVLVDYKSDYVKNESELIEKYSKQLEMYKYALDKINDKKIKQIVLYAFHLNKEIINLYKDS